MTRLLLFWGSALSCTLLQRRAEVLCIYLFILPFFIYYSFVPSSLHPSGLMSRICLHSAKGLQTGGIWGEDREMEKIRFIRQLRRGREGSAVILESGENSVASAIRPTVWSSSAGKERNKFILNLFSPFFPFWCLLHHYGTLWDLNGLAPVPPYLFLFFETHLCCPFKGENFKRPIQASSSLLKRAANLHDCEWWRSEAHSATQTPWLTWRAWMQK